MTLESLSASIARRKSRPFAKMCACPQNSSNVRGRIRAASGSRCGDSRLGACVGRSKSDAIKPSSGVCAPPMRFKKSVSYQQFRMIWHSAIASLYAELSRLWLSPYAGYCALWLSPYACHGSAIASLYAELAVYGLRPYAGYCAAISSPAPSASRFLAQKTPAVIGYCVRDIAATRYRFMMT